MVHFFLLLIFSDVLNFPARISFVKLASYQGTSSSGSIKELIGWNEDIKNKTIVIVEDIVDTGNTLERIVDELVIRKAAEVKDCCNAIQACCLYQEHSP